MLGKLAPQRHDFFPNMKIMPEILIVIGTWLIRIGSVTVAYGNLIGSFHGTLILVFDLGEYFRSLAEAQI